MINFGYSINKPRVIDIDRNNLHKSNEILHEMPELRGIVHRVKRKVIHNDGEADSP